MKKQILLTAFDPFNKASINQSQLVAVELEKLLALQARVNYLVLPTVYDRAAQIVIANINSHKKDDLEDTTVISLGEGDHRTRFETRAYNLDDCESVADNFGETRIQKKIDDQAHEYFDMQKALQNFNLKIPKSQNLSIEISESAGRFVCNNLCYLVSKFCAEKNIPFLFFHVPKHTHSEDMKNPKFVAQNIFNFVKAIAL